VGYDVFVRSIFLFDFQLPYLAADLRLGHLLAELITAKPTYTLVLLLLLQGDATGLDMFGWSVTIFGDTAVALSYDDYTRAAYIFKRDATDDSWSQAKKLTSSESDDDEYLGSGVAISGDYVILEPQIHCLLEVIVGQLLRHSDMFVCHRGQVGTISLILHVSFASHSKSPNKPRFKKIT
jgi:hypothetical protein